MADRLEGRSALGHLLRRAGFGPSPADAAQSFDETRDALLAGLGSPWPGEPEGFDPYVPGAVQQAWLDRMVGGRFALAERLTLFWHGHFATSDAKVQDPGLLWRQHRLFREKGAGRFADLVKAVSRDVAMVRFLDGNANRRGHPNENYARELQELFTLGIGNYTERDVREVARAFSGWGSRHHDFVFTEAFHDRGEKTIHGRTADFDGDAVVDLLVALPASRRFLAGKLLRAFSLPEPSAGEIEEVAGVLERTDGDVGEALAAILGSERFLAADRRRALVRGPVDLAVSALRAAGFTTFPAWAHGPVERMGQILFRPPSVKGWTSGAGWLGSAALVERFRLTRRIADETPPERADAVVASAFDDDVPAPLAPALAAAQGRDRVALALASPEFQLA